MATAIARYADLQTLWLVVVTARCRAFRDGKHVALPDSMNALAESSGIGLGALGVATGRLHMLLGSMVTRVSDPPKVCAI